MSDKVVSVQVHKTLVSARGSKYFESKHIGRVVEGKLRSGRKRGQHGGNGISDDLPMRRHTSESPRGTSVKAFLLDSS